MVDNQEFQERLDAERREPPAGPQPLEERGRPVGTGLQAAALPTEPLLKRCASRPEGLDSPWGRLSRVHSKHALRPDLLFRVLMHLCVQHGLAVPEQFAWMVLFINRHLREIKVRKACLNLHGI